MSDQNPVSSDIFPASLGEEYTFDWIFRNYYAQLCAFSMRYLRDKDDAEDVVEALFLNLWQKKTHFDSLQHARALLYRSTYNSCLNAIRTNQRIQQRENKFGAASDFTEESYLTNLLHTELIGTINREVQNLPKNYGKVISLSYHDGLKNDDIAEQLGFSVQTVKNYKVKALSMLKTKFPKSAWLLLSAFDFSIIN